MSSQLSAVLKNISGSSVAGRIALRYLWSRRSEAFITIISIISVLGVAIGVMVLTMTMAIMTGFESELRSKVIGSSHIYVNKIGGQIPSWRQIRSDIEALDSVQSVAAFTQHQVLLSVAGKSKGVLIRGIEAQSALDQELKKYVQDPLIVESLFTPIETRVQTMADSTIANLPGILVGKALARSLSLYKGSKISLLAPQVGSTPFGLVPRFKRFVIVGIYESGLSGYEEGLAYVSLAEAQRFFRMDDSISGFEITVVDVDKAPEVASEINAMLTTIGAGFYVQDWTQSNKELWQALQLEKRVYFIVLLLIIVMASFSIISMLIMVVLEKRRDIAILKTLGARTSVVGAIFRLQGAVIGGVGVLTGLLLGLLGCVALQQYGFPLPENVFPTSTVPVRIDAINFLVVGIAAFVICLLSTWYPVRRASAVEPSDVLRYE